MPADETDELTLLCWMHPSMQIPIEFDATKYPFKVKRNSSVVDLMDECESLFEQVSAAAGAPHELQINVLWNTKDHKKALNPNDKLGKHFTSGDQFGVYGDVLPVVASNPPKPEEEKLPVTILTGFLGSGKTTLLNYILQEQKEKRIAIIENEFGEISIDDALLKQTKVELAEKIVVMDNGCMCCTIRGDLIKGLQQILDETRKGNKLDAIIIETTGMADPVPIVRTFMSNPELTDELRLDAVITLADARNLPGRLGDSYEEGAVNEAYQQIAYADRIILNKLDLISTDEAIAVKEQIRDINRFARVLPAVRSQVKMSDITNLRAHDIANFANEDIEVEQDTGAELTRLAGHGGGHEHGDGHAEDCTEEHGHGGGHGDGHDGGHSGGHEGGHDGGHDGGHGGSHDGGGEGGHVAAGHGHGPPDKKSRHDSRVNSFAIAREGEIIPKRLSAWMQGLGQFPPDKGTIFRIKAILAVKGHPYKHVFHAVMDVSDEDDAGPWGADEKKISKIVFIGKGLDQAYLRAGFEAIFET